MKRLALRVVAVVAGTYVVLGLLAWIFQRRLIYFPDPGPVRTPRGEAWGELREIEIPTRDGERLAAWYLPGPRPVTVLLLHGNAGHRGHRAGYLQELHALGWGVLLPDYRGYGGSTGAPTEEGLYEDARSCRAWLDAHVEGAVVYLGNSLGTAVAVQLATEAKPAALILRSAFSSLADVGQSAYPFFYVRPLLRDRYDSASKVARVGCPLLCVHGARDEIIPMELGRRLFDAAREPKRWLAFEHAGHNDLEQMAGADYWRALAAFVEAHVTY